MVDVGAGMLAQPRHGPVDEGLERQPLAGPVVRPERPEDLRRGLAHGPPARSLGQRDGPEEVLQAGGVQRIRIAFHVEVDVGRVRHGQRREARGVDHPRGHRPQRVVRAAGRILRRLQFGLQAQPGERGSGHRHRPLLVARGSELLHRRDIHAAQHPTLFGSQPRDQGQIAGRRPALTAVLGEGAACALRTGLRPRRVGNSRRRGQPGIEATTSMADHRRDIIDPERTHHGDGGRPVIPPAAPTPGGARLRRGAGACHAGSTRGMQQVHHPRHCHADRR